MEIDAGEIIAIITAAGALITGVISVIVSGFTSKSAARRDEIKVLQDTITSLQTENQRLFARLLEYEDKLSKLESELADREKRIEVLEQCLREATEGRLDRERRIQELEKEIETLMTRVRSLEDGKPT